MRFLENNPSPSIAARLVPFTEEDLRKFTVVYFPVKFGITKDLY